MVWSKWKEIAYICRFGRQSVYEVLGRDPIAQPLSVKERAYFRAAIHHHMADEYGGSGTSPLGLPSEDGD